ncbi:MAG: hypothetical protein MJZ12_01875 [Prevotella sp.]|nr:hypothetical protein [Prevotella sp.]
MKQKDIEILIRKYLNGDTTPEEEKALALEVSRGDAPQEWKIIAEMLGELTIDEALYDKMMAERSKKPRVIKFWPWVAAACVAALLIVFLAPPREEAKQMAKVTQPVVVKENTKDSVKIEKTQKPITEEKHIAQTAKSKATNTQPKRNAKASSAEPVVTTNDFAMAEDITATEVSTEDIQSVSDEMMEEFYANSANIQRRGQELIYRVSMNSSLPSNNNQYTNL